MKNTAFLVLTLTVLGPASVVGQTPSDLDALVRRGEVYLDPTTGEPFSGPVVRMYDDARTRESGALRDGRWDGVRESYHLNGRISLRETFVNGLLNGPAEAYFKSGQLSATEIYVDGKLHGAYESYWSRGWVAEQGNWAEGEQCGHWVSFGQSLEFPSCPGSSR